MKWVNRVQRGAGVVAVCVFATAVVVGLAGLGCANTTAGPEQEPRPTSPRLNTGNTHAAAATPQRVKAAFELRQAVEGVASDEAENSRRRVHALTARADSKSVDTTHAMIITGVAAATLGYATVRCVHQARRLMADVARCLVDVEMVKVGAVTGRSLTE